MAFEAKKTEWSELYAFVRLLADGGISAGTTEGKRDESIFYPVARVQREEHDGTRQYLIGEKEVRIIGENRDQTIAREDFATVSELIFEAMKLTDGEEVTSPDGVEEFLDEIGIYDLAARTDDRTDLYVAFYNQDAPLTGLIVRSVIGGLYPLLDGGRAANFKFEQTGVKFASPTVNKINAEGDEDDVLSRMLMIERLGGQLKYSDVADKIFRSNLSLIDLHAGRLFAEMTRLMWLDDVTKISNLTEAIKEMNPLKIKDELIKKHGFYEYKVKELLLALINGMRPAKLYTGKESAIDGLIMVDGRGELMCFHKGRRQVMADYLYEHTRLLKGATEKDKYGYLERENGTYYFKLNLKIGFTKR